MAEVASLRANQTNTEDPSHSAPPRDFVRTHARSPRQVEIVLSAQARQHIAVHPPSYMLAATLVLLWRHSACTTLVLPVVAAGRGGRIRVAIDPDAAFNTLINLAVGELDALATACSWPDSLDGAALEWIEAAGPVLAGRADLAFLFCRSSGTARLVYDAGVYRSATATVLARQLAHLLDTLDSDSSTPLADIALDDAKQISRILSLCRGPRIDVPSDATLASLVMRHASLTPDAPAVIHRDQVASYATLERRASALARTLAAHGVGQRDFVPILNERGIDFAVAVLATWMVGAAYVPVDPGYPAARVQYMLTDCGCRVVVAGRAAARTHDEALSACRSLRHVVHPEVIDASETVPWPVRARSCDPAYMIYTSGSTGRPKGAIVRHDGAVNHIWGQAHALGAASIARIAQTAPSSSDISVWQLAAPLALGGTTVIVDDVTDVETLLALVRKHRMFLVELVPVVLRHLVEYARTLEPSERELPDLHWMMVTGESAPPDVINAWLSLYPGVPVVNAYGPTEAADDVAQEILRAPLPADSAVVPIGRPLANLDVYILDERLRPLPAGAVGELCVTGVGVGDGYWQQPDRTAAAFVPTPLPDAAGSVTYRTGDLGRLRDDGTLEYLGRRDHQVQVRGQRIELQEIEAVLRAHPWVADAAVAAIHNNTGDGRLVAYIVPASADATELSQDGKLAENVEILRDHLATRLPKHMVPATIVALPKLPVNPAGKVDRHALPEPPPAVPQFRGDALAVPGEDALTTLASIWQSELGAGPLDGSECFHDLGGDSLTALAIVVAARAAGWRIRTADVLREPTLATLASVAQRIDPKVAQRAGAHWLKPELDPGAVDAFMRGNPYYSDILPMTPAQQGIYLHTLLATDKSTYVDQYVFDLHGEIDLAAFESAWNLAFARHTSLRTAFLRRALRQPAQAVLRELRAGVEFVDLATRENTEAWLARRSAEFVDTGFDLASPPLSHLLLARLAPDRHRLVWTHHHIILDGWSMTRVLEEVLAAHDALCRGTEPLLPAPVPYADYVAWQMTRDLSADVSYWRHLLAGHPGTEMPALPSPAGPDRGYDAVDVKLDAATVQALRRQARAHGVTPTTLVQAAWASVLAELGAGCDVVYGVASSGRESCDPGIGEVIGMCVATLPLRVDLRRRGELTPWLRALQDQAAQAREHDALPASCIATCAAVAPCRRLVDTLLVMSNYPAFRAPVGARLRVEPGPFRTVPAFPLTAIVVPGSQWLLRLVHDRARCDRTAAHATVRRFADLLGMMARGDDPRTC